MAGVINLNYLCEALTAKRAAERLSLRDAAKITGVSASTLSRLEHGIGMPDAGNLAAIAVWLGIPVSRFLTEHEPAFYEGESTMSKIAGAIHADPALSDDAKNALVRMMRGAYDSVTNLDNKTRSESNG